MKVSRFATVTAIAVVAGLCSFASAVAPIEPSISAVRVYQPNGAASWDGTTLFLDRGGTAEIDLLYPSSGVQRLSYRVVVTNSINIFTEMYDWLGINPGASSLWTVRNNYDAARISTAFNAYATNVAPTGRLTPDDLLIKGFHSYHYPGMNFALPWSLGAAYDFEYTFDFDAATTRMVMSAVSGVLVDRTWPSVNAPRALDFYSYQYRWTDGAGSRVTVTNLSVTGIPEPEALPLLVAGGLVVVRRRRS